MCTWLLVAVRTVFLVAIAAGIVAVALIAMFSSAIPTKDYEISVDALKDEQSLFTTARVVVKNTGRLPLTDLLVDYGNSSEPVVSTLASGETRDFFPPEGSQLETVTVTAEPDIKVVQQYRTPMKLPGMIGS